MHKLTFSLLIMVLISILGLGWALDNLFDRLTHQPQDQLRPYREIGSSLARALDLQPFTDRNTLQSLNSNFTLSLTPITEFLLPSELKPDFIRGIPLVLESDQGLTLNFYLPRQQQVLGISGISPAPNKALLNIILTVLFYLGIIVLILLWLSPLIRQLTQLRETAKAFGKGDLNQRISSSSISYIVDIETEFNRMAQRIQALVNDNKLLSSAVSHDLRTPLARLRFGVDALSEMDDPDIRHKYQQRISADVSEMELLVETLLNYARLDQAMIAIEKKPVDLTDLVAHCVHNRDHKEKSVEIIAPGHPLVLMGDQKYLSMLINNILGNALRHAKNKVRMTLTSSTRFTELCIEDDGHGIPEPERKTVIQPFVRGSQTGKTKGYGMGLAIAQRIAQWHQGHLDIFSSTDLKGARIRLRFPGSERS